MDRVISEGACLTITAYFCPKIYRMTERELRKLEGTIRTKMAEIKAQRVSLKDSGIGGLMNTLKKVDEALYEKIIPEYKKMVADYNIFK
jgi:hypothetical protein